MKRTMREKVKRTEWPVRGSGNSSIRKAEFVFVPANEVERKAKEMAAIPYDIDGFEVEHHGP